MDSYLQYECRLCKMKFLSVPVFELRHVPRGVQFFPTPDQFEMDGGVNIEVWHCSGCGLVQTRANAIVYDQYLTSASSYSSAMLAHRREQARAFIERFGLKGKTILEVGCGDGQFLALLSEYGAIGYGVEPSSQAVELGRHKGLAIQQGLITKESRVSVKPFDAFVLLHVLEHVPDPNDLLQGIYANLRDKAVGLIEVPSLEQILENQRFYDFIPDHLAYFSMQTLRLVLEKNGFDLLDMYRDWQGEHIVALVRKRAAYDFISLHQSVAQLSNEFTRFVRTNIAAGKKIAIWGASCHALVLLAVSGVQGISYVIDSAPYKQGRFTPVSHLPIVSPETLKHTPVDIIIIIAPRYAHEIMIQARRELKFHGMIALLNGTNLEIIQNVYV